MVQGLSPIQQYHLPLEPVELHRITLREERQELREPLRWVVVGCIEHREPLVAVSGIGVRKREVPGVPGVPVKILNGIL